MDDTKKLSILRGMYVGALADACFRFQKAGILEEVTAAKHEEQIKTGAMKASFMGISTIPDAFLSLQDIFACANWIVSENDGSYEARASACQLCAKAKQLGAGNPCHLYCLSPIEGLVKAIRPEASFGIEDTLWTGEKCLVRIRMAEAAVGQES